MRRWLRARGGDTLAAVLRSIPLIVAAIEMTRPGVSKEEATRYATTLQEVAREHDFDPFSVVAIVHYESAWLPHVVSRNGRYFGLGQIAARYIGACRGDADPIHNPSDGCKQVKVMLVDGEANLRQMGEIITRSRKLCKKKTGTAWFHQWLAAYQGRNYPKKKKWCQPGKQTWRVIEYRKKLIRELVHKKRKVSGAKPPESS